MLRASHVLLLLPALACLIAACGDERVPELEPERPAAAPPAGSDEPVPGPDVVLAGDGEGQPEPLDPEEVQRRRDELNEKQEAWRAKMNEMGRGLIDSFQRRVYSPQRDGALAFAEGVATVRAGGAEGAFRVVYDVERPEDARVTVVPEGDVAALPKGSDAQVRQFAELALQGPYRTVVQYLPPIDLIFTYSKDKSAKIVTAPPHKLDLQVSYRFDERELISVRGISVRPAAEITNYEWTFFHGRYLMSGFSVHGTDAACDLEYDDRETSGVVLLRRARLTKEDRVFDVAFSWERVDTSK